MLGIYLEKTFWHFPKDFSLSYSMTITTLTGSISSVLDHVHFVIPFSFKNLTIFLSFSYLESIGITGILILSNLVFLIPELSVSIRRLHDVNKSGLWILLSLTIIGIIPLFYFYCQKGDEGLNDFGSPR